MDQPRILIAGIGNIFLGDDGFGCEVLKQLQKRTWPDNVRLVDFGIRGFDLTYALLDGYDLTIFVDATPRGGLPGTIYTIEPTLDDLDALDANASMVETHGMKPMRVLGLAKSMGGQFKKILLVGCEPETLGPEEGAMGLSAVVQLSVAKAVRVIETLVVKMMVQSFQKQS